MNKLIVAAFDFDGTISYRDSLLPFLIYKFGYWKTLKGIIYLLPWFIGCAFHMISRDKTKEQVALHFFKGLPIQDLRDSGKSYAADVLPKQIKKEAIERLRWHQNRGDRTILVSASYDIYLKPWADSMGFDDILTSRLRTDQNGIVDGYFLGFNCRAKEKVRRLNELLGEKSNYILYAYGDSAGDKEMLALADFPYYRSWSELPSDSIKG